MPPPRRRTLQSRLHALASHAPALEAALLHRDADAASADAPSDRAHAETAPRLRLYPTPQIEAALGSFIQTCEANGWLTPQANWPEWMNTPEAARLRDDPEALAAATPRQLAWLLTVVVRQDRFCDGVLFEALRAGLLRRIVQRAAVLERTAGRTRR